MCVLFLVASSAKDLVLSHNFTSKNLESATMASHGDNAEGGINEEFSDIIKWRSGMLVYLYIFAELFCTSYHCDDIYYRDLLTVQGGQAALLLSICCQKTLSQKSCCAWITSVPMEARDQGHEQQRHEGNRRRLIRAEKGTQTLTNGSRERRRKEWWDG